MKHRPTTPLPLPHLSTPPTCRLSQISSNGACTHPHGTRSNSLHLFSILTRSKLPPQEVPTPAHCPIRSRSAQPIRAPTQFSSMQRWRNSRLCLQTPAQPQAVILFLPALTRVLLLHCPITSMFSAPVHLSMKMRAICSRQGLAQAILVMSDVPCLGEGSPSASLTSKTA